MKKIVFFLAVFISIICMNKTYADTILDETSKEYSVSIRNGDPDRLPMTVKGYMIYESIELTDYKMLSLDYVSSNSNVGYLLSNSYYNKTSYYQLTSFEGEYNICDSESRYIDVENYSYLYLMKYENKVISPRATATFKLSYTSIQIECFDYYDVLYKGDTLVTTTSDKLLDVSDLTRFIDIKAPYDLDISIISNNYSSNYQVGGTYTVEYLIKGKEYTNEFILTINVISNNVPEISSNEGITVIDIDNLVSLETIKSYFTATDYEDGDLTDKLVFETDYSENITKTGEYYLKITVTDKDENQAILNVKIYVIDTIPPVISTTYVEISNKELYTYDDIFELIDINDNYASEFTYEILDNNYVDNYKKPGIYYIEYKISDGANYNTIKLEVRVIDTESPIVNINNIATTIREKVSLEDIYKNISVIDDSEYEIMLDTTDYDTSYNIRGVYNIVVTVKDSSNNTTQKNLTITVISNEVPVIYYNDCVKVYSNTTLTHENLISFLREISKESYDNSSVSVIEGTYFKTPNVAGEYDIIMTTTLKDGTEIKEKYNVLVIEQKVDKKEKSFFSKIGGFFKKIWKSIVKFFKKIF